MGFVYATLFLGLIIDLTGLAAVNFTKEPPKVVYTRSGKDVSLQWDYEVEKSDLKLFAFQWFTFIPPFDLGNRKQIYLEKNNGQKQLGGQIPASLQGRVGFEGKATLIIKNVSKADNNYYRFVIGSIDHGDVSSLITLFVTEPPRPLGEGITPPCQTSTKGQKANFTCRVLGEPSPNVTWSRKHKTLTDNKKYTISGTNGNSTLVINNLDKDDNGEYFCVASNPAGEILKLPFYVTVPYVLIDKNISSTRVSPRRNSTEKLTCVAVGWPEPKTEWINKRTGIITTAETIFVSSSDYGNYTCRASNIAGNDTQSSEVLEDAPVFDGATNVLKFDAFNDASYYTVVGHLPNEANPVYLGMGISREVQFDWNSFDEKLPGETVTINFLVLADGDPNKPVTYVKKIFERTSSAVGSHQVGFVKFVAPLAVFLLTVLFL